MAGEAFHEIQLNGKQLVFLFMAATVVAVVIFLCGVMVGRGVRPQRVGEVTLSAETPADPTAEARPTTPVTEAAGTPGGQSETPEQLSYPERLADPAATPEALNEPGAPPAEPRAPAPPSAEENVAAPPSGAGFTVQVAAVKERAEADAIVKRLTTKGYQAYVMPPAAGAPRVYRVRVGRFRDRREAESVAGRLRKEEQFKPWITR